MGRNGEKARERVVKEEKRAGRISEAVELLIAGASISDVTASMAISYEQATRVVVQARERIHAEADTSVARMREVELRRCGALQTRLWARLTQTEVNKRTGEAPPMHGQAARLAETILKVMDQRARYMPGLQVKSQVEVSGPDGQPIAIPVVAGSELIELFTRTATAQEKAADLRAMVDTEPATSAADEEAESGDLEGKTP